jgi:hypothetical protein
MSAAAVKETIDDDRLTFADLDHMSGELRREELKATVRATLRARLTREHHAQESAFSSGHGDYNRVLHRIVKELLAAEERRSSAELAQRSYEQLNAAANARADRERNRPAQWKALSPIERALYIVAYQTRNRDLFRIAELVGDDTTAQPSNMPDSFQP